VNLGILAWSGVSSGGDTGIYLDGARQLMAGEPLTARQPSYLGYIVVVAFFTATGLGLVGLVVAQIAAATLAAAAVYRLAVAIGGSVAGVLAVLFFALDFETNRWHAYVLADSLYTSALAIAVWLVHDAGARGSSARRRAGAAVVLIVAALIRPEGWFLIPAAAIYWVLRGVPANSGRALGVGAVALGCAALVIVLAPRLQGNVQAVGPGEMLRQGQTIWDYDGWRLSMPDAAAADRADGGAADAVAYALRHPVSTLRLMAARLFVHFAHVRPFFSTPHNLYSIAWLVPVYALAIYGAWSASGPLVWWIAAAIGTQTLVVALTHADWDGRYLAHVLPIIYPFAGTGAALLIARSRPR
jgi:hypothetical protein